MQGKAVNTVLSIIRNNFHKKNLLQLEDLIEIGLFESKKKFNWWRLRHKNFPLVRLSKRKFVIPKRDLVEWIKEQN